MTEADMPPPERPKRTRRYGEQEHLREDAGMEQGPEQGAEPAEHLREDAGSSDQAEREEADKGLVENHGPSWMVGTEGEASPARK